jgi:hypothetical protein
MSGITRGTVSTVPYCEVELEDQDGNELVCGALATHRDTKLGFYVCAQHANRPEDKPLLIDKLMTTHQCDFGRYGDNRCKNWAEFRGDTPNGGYYYWCAEHRQHRDVRITEFMKLTRKPEWDL